MPRTDVEIRALAHATDVDVLPATSVVLDRGDYCVVKTPTNPTYFWGNFLLFREPPHPGDRSVWEEAFRREFRTDEERGSRHIALGWDVVNGELGSAEPELGAAGYVVDRTITLVAAPDELRAHQRRSTEVEVRRLDPAPGRDQAAWDAVTAIQVAGREQGHDESGYRRFSEAAMADRRARFLEGDGAWYVAEHDGEVVGSCGIVVTDGRGRFQAVDTAESHRRRGIASRLVVAAGQDAFDELGASRLVIVAEEGYHATALYESLGFVARERTPGACWWPGAPRAALHPERGGWPWPAQRWISHRGTTLGDTIHRGRSSAPFPKRSTVNPQRRRRSLSLGRARRPPASGATRRTL